ncbi:DUF1353 domain-containing protein [Herbaspirillum seropedicae]|uniref:DUF1353 domain-containing protein n=1 Tax=Herbaspirillum seropedicae (strain SmR1) TaxID=757424 RepID=D8IV38_HERSS|nr:DUF1353 domain-containing protein [Herbaspirillum seropedicae]ADJ61757.1 conserved hypothetical protein [Herbaspirillum seropedicae SmR1]AKN63954.1 phage tail protein [Herbaspirillum seropedicae]UMU19869.1 DUF1353 domain-containing protein [Herbaspirillum seropedicae]
MSGFTTPADLRMLDNYQWQLLRAFDYHIGGYPSQRIVRVPAGTITDLASVPRCLWAVFPPHGRYAKAAIVHDYLYESAIGSKREADRIFLEAMVVLGVPGWRRWVMYLAVRLFGRGRYGRDRREGPDGRRCGRERDGDRG